MTGTDPVLAGLCAQFEAKYSQGQTIINNLGATGQELAQAETLFKECEGLQIQIDERHALAEKRSQLEADGSTLGEWSRQPVKRLPFSGLPAQPAFQFQGRIDAGLTQAEKMEATGGFKSLGHLAHALYRVGPDGRGDQASRYALKQWEDCQTELRRKDLTLSTKAPSGMFEESDPDGGILIPREYSNQVYTRMVAMNQLLQYLSPIPIGGNTMTIPALKEDSRADGLRGGGVLGYWQGEANQYVSSKSKLRDINLKLHKLTVLTFVTEELMNDSAGAIQAFLLAKAPLEINFKINDALINGNGDGMPLGALKATSLITVNAVSGQGNNTFVYQNVLAMYARCVAGQRGSMVWLYNQDVEPQLYSMFMPTGSAAGVALLTPNQEQAGGFRLMGRPALVMEQCNSLGTAGDVIAYCPEGIAAITKGGIESFMSMHLRFDYDEVAYKWRFRFDAQPYDLNALTPYRGTNTVSSLVVLNSTRT